ncbi:hypothetical protein DSO57_1023740 [Entomophthora muscae]|uniref:Uncharacterized protein n=1 Tax=Entomophthora muscae TaxID=34485 RepID=A0ACC2RHD8_9FUNG|nr:hypothetical protein DSO57_1023740 [Entomophthora muscae]
MEIFQEVANIIKNAIDSGYRHIDTAAFYRNEEMVGEAIKTSNIPRGDLFITTKLWCTDLLPERVRPALELSLKKLQVEYVDLYLIHWPVAFKSPQTTPPEVIPVDLSETWKELEALVFEGKIKSIGVSNFTVKKLDKLLETARIKPAVNQVELHPYLTQLDLKKYCVEKDILLTAYSPLGRSKEPRIDSDPTILQISEKYKKTPAQIMLNWAVQRGTAVVPRSSNLQRQKDNLEQFALDQSDMDSISNLNRDHRYILNAQWGIQNLFSD